MFLMVLRKARKYFLPIGQKTKKTKQTIVSSVHVSCLAGQKLVNSTNELYCMFLNTLQYQKV